MNSFPWSSYNRWQEPPNEHELDNCYECHDSGLHVAEIEKWADKWDCAGCDDKLHFAIKRSEYCLEHHAWYCEESHQEKDIAKS